jgi:uncharacterized protein (TIRG00374 family)
MPRTFLGLAFTALFGVLFIVRTDREELVESLKDIAYVWLVPAVLLNFADVWFQALRLSALLRHLSPPRPSRLFAGLLVGIMGNNVLPMRMGMVLRAEYLSSRYNFQVVSMLSVMAVEGFMDGLVLAALFVPVLLLVGADTTILVAVVLSGGVAVGGLIALRMAHSPDWMARLEPLGRLGARLPLPAAAGRQLASWARAFGEGVASVRSGRSLALAALATLGAWLTTVAVYVTVGHAMSLDVDWQAYLVLTAAVNVTGLIQFSQGNIGPYEFVVAEVMTGFGASSGEASAYAIVTHLVRLLPPTIAGLALFGWHSVLAPLKPGVESNLT